MSSSLTLLAVLALTLAAVALSAPAPAPTSGQVFTIKATSHRLSAEQTARMNKKRMEANPMLRKALENVKFPTLHGATGAASLNLNDFYQFALLANISVGTPAQTVTTGFDLWSNDMSLVEVNAQFDTEYCDYFDGDDRDSCISFETDNLAAKHPYNVSASSTAVPSKKKFRGSYEPGDKGTITTDTVNLDKVSANISFGDITQLGFYLDMVPMDGVIGLSPGKSSNKIDNVLKQLVGSLAQPVFTVHVNRSLIDQSAWPNTDAEIMFGSNALPQCNGAHWQTLKLGKPQAGLAFSYTTTKSLTIDGVSDDSCNSAIPAISHPLIILDQFQPMQVSVQVAQVFQKASGATFNADFNYFEVDCTTVDTLPAVNIGLGDGNTLAIKPRDYVLDLSNTDFNVCLLWVQGLYDEGNTNYQSFPITLDQVWMNNHCLSYDISANTLSITDALPNNGN